MDKRGRRFFAVGIVLGIGIILMMDAVRPSVREEDIRFRRIAGCWKTAEDGRRFTVTVQPDTRGRLAVTGFSEPLFLIGRSIVRAEPRHITLFGEVTEDGNEIQRFEDGKAQTAFVRANVGPCD